MSDQIANGNHKNPTYHLPNAGNPQENAGQKATKFKHYHPVVRLFIGVFCGLFLFLTASLGFIYLQSPFIPLIFINHMLYQDVMNFMIATWLLLPAVFACLEVFFGTRLRVFSNEGELIKGGGGLPLSGWNLILMNHRTRLDWYYIWLCFLHMENPLRFTRVFKVILKASIRHYGGFGWAMQVSRFIFLSRRWEEDERHLTGMLTSMTHHVTPHSILLFPEGTDFEPDSKASSDRFAEKAKLDKYEHVLHPRVTGTVAAINTLLTAKSLERVVDVTVKYPDMLPSSELSLLMGRAPKEIWYFVKTIPVADLDKEDLTGWLQKLWANKELKLKLIEEKLDQCKENNNEFSSGTELGPEVKLRSSDANSSFHYFVLGYWAIFCVIACYAICTNIWAQLYAILVVTGTIVVSVKHGGWDKYELERFRAQYSLKKLL